MVRMILLAAAVGMVAAGFAESQQTGKVLQEDFTRRLKDVEMCLEVKDGEHCLRIYHDMWKKGYRLTEGDKRNVEGAFDICKRDCKVKLNRCLRDPRFKEDGVRKWWTEIMALYNDLTSKQLGDAGSKAKKQLGKVSGAKPIVRLSVAYMAIGESDLQKIGNSQSATGDGALQRRGDVFDVLRDIVCGSNNCNTASVGTTLDITKSSCSQAGITRMSDTGHAFIESWSMNGVKIKSGGTVFVKVEGESPTTLEELEYGVMVKAKGGLVDVTMMDLYLEIYFHTIVPAKGGGYDRRNNSTMPRVLCPIGQTTFVRGAMAMVDKNTSPSGIRFLHNIPLLNWFLTDCGKAVSDRRLVIMICPEIVDGKQNVTPDGNNVINIPMPKLSESDGAHECEACKKRGGFWSWLDWFIF